MKNLRFLLSIFGFGAAAAFAVAPDGQSGRNNVGCANDSACGGTHANCCLDERSRGATDKSCCNDGAGGCGNESNCCDANGARCDGKAALSAAVHTSAGTPGPTTSAIIQAYLPIADALAADNFEKARHAAGDLVRATRANGPKAVFESALDVTHASDLTAARNAFKRLSALVAPIAEANNAYVVMTCPMAKADWVQTDTRVRNPYFGSAMLTCGAPKKG